MKIDKKSVRRLNFIENEIFFLCETFSGRWFQWKSCSSKWNSSKSRTEKIWQFDLVPLSIVLEEEKKASKSSNDWRIRSINGQFLFISIPINLSQDSLAFLFLIVNLSFLALFFFSFDHCGIKMKDTSRNLSIVDFRWTNENEDGQIVRSPSSLSYLIASTWALTNHLSTSDWIVSSRADVVRHRTEIFWSNISICSPSQCTQKKYEGSTTMNSLIIRN